MPFNYIIMPYKENCKVEGEIMTKFKIARMYFKHNISQKDIASKIDCHYNTINNIIKECRQYWSQDISKYILEKEKFLEDKLELFNFFKSSSRRPKSNRRSLNGENEKFILEKQEKLNYGFKRLFKHLKRQNYDSKIFTLGKIRGVYKRNDLKTKKIRTVNGERRALYNYDQIEAFEYLQYDTKHIADKHALPKEIYDKFKYSKEFPKYQWTIIDAKTKTRFLAWSHTLNSPFGFWFLEFVVFWLRSHNVRVKIYTQVDGGGEFCSGSKRKLKNWNDKLAKHNVEVYDTDGVKWKQNLVERSHRVDDEEFYCPKGEFIHNKDDFLVEAQQWIIYNNHRPDDGIILKGISPKEKLDKLGFYNAEDICNFPCLILDDYFKPFQIVFNPEMFQKSQNVFAYYLFYRPFIAFE